MATDKYVVVSGWTLQIPAELLLPIHVRFPTKFDENHEITSSPYLLILFIPAAGLLFLGRQLTVKIEIWSF
jgi:hypothetical protein